MRKPVVIQEGKVVPAVSIRRRPFRSPPRPRPLRPQIFVSSPVNLATTGILHKFTGLPSGAFPCYADVVPSGHFPMDVQKMLRIDRWAGVPLCFLATALRPLFVRRPPATPAPPRSILFVKLAEQGSTVLAYQALHNAVERVGRENVYMMVFDDNRFILDLLEVIPRENVLPVNSTTLASLLRTALAAIRRLRRLRIDAAVDLEFFARSSALLVLASGAPVRIGLHAYFGEGPYRGDLMTHRIRYNPHVHTAELFAMLVRALDLPVDKLPQFDRHPALPAIPPPAFVPTARELADVRALLTRHLGHSGPAPLILLNANASDMIPLRRWDSARYVDLAGRLLARFPEVSIAFTGAANEAAKSRALARELASSRCFSIAGETTLRQLLVLYHLSDVLVTNDSGPAHFATLTPIHAVTLFGPETPLLFSALTPRNTPLWAGIACSPCVSALNNRQSACRDNACMQRLGVEQVFAAVCESYRLHRESSAAAAQVSPGVEVAA